MKSNEPAWLKVARRFTGIAEVKGPHHNPTIISLLDIADGKTDGKGLQGIADDETPWCASYVSAVLELAGIQSARSAWARSYLNWGFPLHGPAVGAIAVLERGPKSGHVGFVVGRDAEDNLLLLGGNQSDMVKISAFDMQRVIGFRWPEGHSAGEISFRNLPLGKAGISNTEA
jgi:uncharacterized protein (TIGR02594 family)